MQGAGLESRVSVVFSRLLRLNTDSVKPVNQQI